MPHTMVPTAHLKNDKSGIQTWQKLSCLTIPVCSLQWETSTPGFKRKEQRTHRLDRMSLDGALIVSNNIYIPEQTNRTLLVEMLEATDNYAMKTFFEKPGEKLITYRDDKNPDGPGDWSPTKFAQVEFVLA